MQTREEKQILSEFSRQLNLSFDWFEKNFTNSVSTAFNEFWEINNRLKLISISENTCSLTGKEEFFVTRIRLNKELSIFIRLSKTLVKNLLENVLGSNGKSFNIEKITNLEAKILTGFNQYLYKQISHLIKPLNEISKSNIDYNECNLLFFVGDNKSFSGKIMIKVPIMAIRPDLITLNEETFSISNFLKTEAFVKLKVGQSKIKLNDLKNLEKDDIVLLEESQASVMTLVYRGVEKEIKLQTNTEIMLNDEFDVDGANSKGEEYMGNDIYNMWDSIQVEIGAEFEKVKLSLGELKQISEGLVVDICSVYDNKIDLKVEEKKVASGELVIINDRYGVRINEVFTVEPELETDNTDNENFDNNNENLDDEAFDENFEDENSEKNQEISEEDAFDYSDFDVDDEDI